MTDITQINENHKSASATITDSALVICDLEPPRNSSQLKWNWKAKFIRTILVSEENHESTNFTIFLTLSENRSSIDAGEGDLEISR